jgi:biopolymer transport protein ExbD
MRLPQPRPIEPALPVAAFAGLVVLLGFFFLLSTSFAPDLGLVRLPRAPGPSEAASGAACLIVQRKVNASSGEALAWRLSDRMGDVRELAGPRELYLEASRIVDADPERTFLLRIDAGVRYGVVDDLLEILRNAGVRNVVFGARPDVGGGA